MVVKLSSVGAIKLQMRLFKRFGAALFVLLMFSVGAAFADDDLDLPRVVVSSGGPYISRSLNIQRFKDVIDIPGEYAMQPLSMVCTDGSLTAPGFSWVRVFLMPDGSDQNYQVSAEPLGRMLVNESSFLFSPRIYLDMSRQFKPGKNRIIVEGAGRVGAEFSWEMRSIGRPNLFMPEQSATIAGAWFDINGSGFSLRPNENTVQLGPVTLPVGQSNYSSLKVFIPQQFPPGNYDLSVAIRNFKSRVVKVQIESPKK